MQLHLPLGEIRTPAGTYGMNSKAPDAPSVAVPGPAQPFDVCSVIFTRHRRARRYILRLDHEGRVRVTIPRGGSRREAIAFAERNREWIVRQRARAADLEAPMTATADLLARAQVVLSARLFELAARHGLTVTRVSVRNQRTRWGSCGRDGHICLNWRVALMPAWVSDYVLLHELMHLRRMDHSRAYWKLVAAACPEYLAARRWLQTNGPALR